VDARIELKGLDASPGQDGLQPFAGLHLLGEAPAPFQQKEGLDDGPAPGSGQRVVEDPLERNLAAAISR
jgi:hypothetical protein